MNENIVNVDMALFQCQYEYVFKGIRRQYTCNIVAASKEEAEQIIHLLYQPDLITCYKIKEVHAIGLQTCMHIAQGNFQRCKAMDQIQEDEKDNRNQGVHTDFALKWSNLPEIRYILNRKEA